MIRKLSEIAATIKKRGMPYFLRRWKERTFGYYKGKHYKFEERYCFKPQMNIETWELAQIISMGFTDFGGIAKSAFLELPLNLKEYFDLLTEEEFDKYWNRIWYEADPELREMWK